MRNCAKHFLLLADPSGNPFHEFSKGRCPIQGQQIRVWLVANHAVVDVDVRALIVVCKSKTCCLALRPVKDELPFSAPFEHDVNSYLSNEKLLCPALCGALGTSKEQCCNNSSVILILTRFFSRESDLCCYQEKNR